MTAFVGDGFAGRVTGLVLGIEPQDAARSTRVLHPVRIDIEHGASWSPADRRAPYAVAVGPGAPRAVVSRRSSGRYAVVYHAVSPDADYFPRVDSPLAVRIYDHDRRFVPRRLEIPLLTRAQAEADSRANPVARRVRRPALFAGAAYGPTSRATGIRGRVLRGRAPVRWGRVVATLTRTVGGTPIVVGRAHVDDRGEFLLLLGAAASPFDSLADPVTVRVTVHGRAAAPVPEPPSLPELDPWWDLPLETLPEPGAEHNDDDPVAAGTSIPAAFDGNTARDVQLRLGRILATADVDPFVLA